MYIRSIHIANYMTDHDNCAIGAWMQHAPVVCVHGILVADMTPARGYVGVLSLVIQRGLVFTRFTPEQGIGVVDGIFCVLLGTSTI